MGDRERPVGDAKLSALVPPLASGPLTGPSVSTAIHDQLRTLIVRGRLLPGARITETDVAQQLKGSRTPAREALQRLRQEGLLEPVGPEHGGKIRLAVASMSAAEATELYRAAGALEGLVARAVAEIGAAAREALAGRLMKADRAFRREANRKAPDWDRLFELHDAFHRTLVEELAGPRLRRMLDDLRPHLDRYEYCYGPLLGPAYDATYAEHADIIRAVASGDAEWAERSVRQNWFGGGERLASAVARSGALGFLRGMPAERRSG